MAELEDLLVDGAQLDRSLLAEVLLPLIGIDAGKHEIVPKEGWTSLDAEQRILVFLLGRKAMAAMPELELGTEGASPTHIEVSTGVKGGTLRPKLRSMKRAGLLSQDSAKLYSVPTHALLRAKALITGGQDDQQGHRTPSPSRRRRPSKRRA